MANSAKPLTLSRQEQFILAAYDILLIVKPVLQIIKTGIVILAAKTDSAYHGT